MRRLAIFCFVFVVCFAAHLMAQDARCSNTQLTFHLQKNAVDTTGAFAKHEPLSLINNNLFSFQSPLSAPQKNPVIVEPGVYYSAFFCRMETTLRKRFNMWIKFRAVNDESF